MDEAMPPIATCSISFVATSPSAHTSCASPLPSKPSRSCWLSLRRLVRHGKAGVNIFQYIYIYISMKCGQLVCWSFDSRPGVRFAPLGCLGSRKGVAGPISGFVGPYWEARARRAALAFLERLATAPVFAHSACLTIVWKIRSHTVLQTQ